MAVTINGTTGITNTGDYDAEDNDKILLGTGDDLQIYHDGSNSYVSDAGTGLLVIGSGGKLTGQWGIGTSEVAKNDHSLLSIHKGDSGSCYLYFTNTTTGETGDDGFTIGMDGDENPMLWNRENTSIRIATNGTERGRWLAGGGLTFNGDTAAANAIDDYEEGTFTPTYEMTTSTGTFGYALQQGRYTKVGNMVHYQISIQANSHSGTNSGMLQIAGLPFGVGGTQPDAPSGGSPFFIVGGDFDTAYGVALQINQSEKIEFYRQIQATGNNYDNISSNELTLASLFIKCSGFYMTT